MKRKIESPYAIIIALASLIAMAISWIATPVIRFGRAWMALRTAPNVPSGGRRFHLLEFRWVRAILHTVNTTFATFYSLMATTTWAMIRHFGLTTALTRLRYTSATITEATDLTWLTMARYGNERSSPDSNMLSGAKPGKSPHFTLSPAPA